MTQIATLQCGMGWFPEQEGGLNRVYYNLARSLPTIGVGVRGLVTGTAPDQDANVRAFASPTAPLPARWWGARRAAAATLSAHPVDLVASHFALYTFPLLDGIRGRPLVVHFHGPWASEASVERRRLLLRARQAVETAVYRRADRFIVLSEAFSTVLQETYAVPAERIRVVPGGTDVGRFDVPVSRDEARRRLGWPEGRPVVLAVRRLARRMGLETLIDAMSLLHERVPDALLYVAGRGPLAAELRDHIAALGLDDHVRLLGYVPDEDLPLAYRAATLSVVPTQALEGFGLITVESLAAGTPVFVTPVGGLPEAVRGLSPSLVMPGSDAPSMARHLAAALQDEFAIPSADQCREYTRTHFDWSTVARRTRSVYEEVL